MQSLLRENARAHTFIEQKAVGSLSESFSNEERTGATVSVIDSTNAYTRILNL